MILGTGPLIEYTVIDTSSPLQQGTAQGQLGSTARQTPRNTSGQLRQRESMSCWLRQRSWHHVHHQYLSRIETLREVNGRQLIRLGDKNLSSADFNCVVSIEVSIA